VEKKLLSAAWETRSRVTEAQSRCCHRHLHGALMQAVLMAARVALLLPSPLFQHMSADFWALTDNITAALLSWSNSHEDFSADGGLISLCPFYR